METPIQKQSAFVNSKSNEYDPLNFGYQDTDQDEQLLELLVEGRQLEEQALLGKINESMTE